MRAAVLPFALLLGLAPVAGAETANLSYNQAGEAGATARLILAQRAYENALSSGDPIILISAIRLAREVTLRFPAGWTKTTEGDPATEATDGKTAAPDPAGPESIAIARGLAGDDPDLQDLVYDLDAQLPHARRPTVINATAVLNPDQSDSWTLVLAGQSTAEIGLIGDGDTALGLTIADENGVVVCAIPPTKAPALCRFTPARNGFFRVTVRNTGLIQNSYRLLGN